MATTATRAKKPATPKEEPNLPAVISDDEFTAALREHGFLPTRGNSDIQRLVIKGNQVKFDGDVIGVYDPRTKEPALIVQLASEPRQLQSLWFSKPDDPDSSSNRELAQYVERPDVAGHFCKSYFDDPKQNRRYAEDGTSCDECPVHPFVPKDQLPEAANGKKCSWRAEAKLYILDKQDDGTYARIDDTEYTLGLATTSVIEFFGSSSKKNDSLAGSVSPMHTMARIAKLGMQKWGVAGIERAKTSLAAGLVICGLHIPEQTSGNRSWSVPSFDPIDILELEDQPQLTTSAPASEQADDPDLPF